MESGELAKIFNHVYYLDAVHTTSGIAVPCLYHMLEYINVFYYCVTILETTKFISFHSI